MTEIRYITDNDKPFWLTLDRHISEQELERKIRDRMGYIILSDGEPAGILRYNLFWDSIPFCTLLYVRQDMQRKGLGRELMLRWENDMRSHGCGIVMTSTQVDEQAQHFYRSLGYKDSGGLVIDIIGYEQPMEMFLIKAI